MKTVSLGYEDETRISKLEIARVQLCEAISLFLANKYVCSITLAGAAEAVLAGLAKQSGGTSIVEDSAKAIQELRQTTNLSIGGSMNKNDLFTAWNLSRNRLKHHDKEEAETIVINLFDEAYWMIRRAIANAAKIELTIENKVDFENWIIINVNM